MSKEFKINQELASVEAALSSLEPVASSVDRDRLMFLAGRASVDVPAPPSTRRPVHWLWPVTTATSLVLALSFGCLIFLRPYRVEKDVVYIKTNESHPQAKTSKKLWYDDVKSETVEVERPKPPPGMEGMDYLTLSRLIASKGVEGLPSPKKNATAPSDLPRNRPLTLHDLEKMMNDY